MKITKRQLKRIIKEEKQKLLGEEVSFSVSDTLRQLEYRIPKEIDARMSLENRIWREDPEVVDAVLNMLDNIKANFSRELGKK